MALVACSDPKLRKPFPKPLMLKDFLLDDMSSCSSNGFKSFPRRHCCTTVRYLVEKDLKAGDSTKSKRLLRKSRSKAAATTTISALQRASEAVINAVKLIPFPSVKASSSSVQKTTRKGILPRSFSRKLLKRKFWRRTAAKEDISIERWKSLRDFLQEKPKPSDHSRHHSNTTTTTTIDSTSATSNSNSWSDVEFTSDYLQSSCYNSESSVENNAFSSKKYFPEKKFGKRVGAAVGEGAMERTSTTCSVENTKEWPNEEEKEQFSPVSVLDCPFEDEDEEEEICSPFQRRAAHMEGTKQKIRRFESLAELEPVDLEKRIALSELDDEQLNQSTRQPFSMSTHRSEEEMVTEREAQGLLELIKARTPLDSSKFNADTLMLDFFKERIVVRHGSPKTDDLNQELLKVAEDWISGHYQDLLLGWEVQSNRKAYIKDMEENGKWRKLEEEKEELASEVGNEVLTFLLNEILFELSARS